MTGKTLFAVRWYDVVACRIRREIKQKNNGRWPENLADWFAVCGRCGYELMIVPPAEDLTACLLIDRRIIICAFTEDTERMAGWIAHELCEGLLCDGEADGDLLEWPRCVEDCHETARRFQALALIVTPSTLM